MTIDKIAAHTDRIPINVIIVYDKNNDDTIPVVKRIQNNYKFDITLIKNYYNKGVLNAIKTGFKAAKGRFVLVTMADLSDDPKNIKDMYRLMVKGYAVVCASRYMKNGGQKGGSFIKRSFSRFIGLSLHYFTGIPTHDTTNNFKMYSKHFIDNTTIESIGGFELGMELTLKAYVSGYNITEIPTVWNDRTAGKSHFNFIGWAPRYFKWYLYGMTNRPKRKI